MQHPEAQSFHLNRSLRLFSAGPVNPLIPEHVAQDPGLGLLGLRVPLVVPVRRLFGWMMPKQLIFRHALVEVLEIEAASQDFGATLHAATPCEVGCGGLLSESLYACALLVSRHIASASTTFLRPRIASERASPRSREAAKNSLLISGSCRLVVATRDSCPFVDEVVQALREVARGGPGQGRPGPKAARLVR